VRTSLSWFASVTFVVHVCNFCWNFPAANFWWELAYW